MAAGTRQVGEYTRAVAAELRSIAARYHFTQGDVAERSGVPLATLSKIMRGIAPIDVEQLDRICAAMNITPASVLDAAGDVTLFGAGNAPSSTPRFDSSHPPRGVALEYDPSGGSAGRSHRSKPTHDTAS